MTVEKIICRVCGTAALEEMADFADLPRVTSDCKPFRPGGRLAVCDACGAVQTPGDARWSAEADEIYQNYEPYFQSGGVEQAVFDAKTGTPRLRSAVILDRLAEQRNLSGTGRVLDVGCGNGVLLSAFAKIKPEWDLYGHDLSRLNEAPLKEIPNFHELYTGALEDLPDGFDVITMIHSLEHFPDPFAGLKALAGKLSPDGCLFIQVPNAAVTPFDLVIADHASHFTATDFDLLIRRAGLSVGLIAEDWITKELSAISLPAGAASTDALNSARPVEIRKHVADQINWLGDMIQNAEATAQAATAFGVFGTSVAAMWLTGYLDDKIAFFVDEDPSRKDTTLLGRPVYAPADAPDGADIFVPLIPEVATRVAARLARAGITYHTL